MKKHAKILSALVVTAGMVLVTTPSFAADVDPIDIEITQTIGSVGGDGFVPAGGPAATTAPYPASVPAGYEAFEGVSSLFVGFSPGGERVLLYCVQIGIMRGDNYSSVNQSAADIDNAGYVARIVNRYYPSTALPALGGPDPYFDQLRADAVQSTIWYFTDGWVLPDDDPLRDVVSDMVADVLAAGPMGDVEFDPDMTFTLSGPTGSFAPGTMVGPFTSTAALRIARYKVNAGGAIMYGDAAGTTIIPADTAISPTQPVWVRSDAAGNITLTSKAEVDAASGTFFMGPAGDFGPIQTLVGAAQRFDVSDSLVAKFEALLPDTGAANVIPFLGVGSLLLGAGIILVIGRQRRGRAARR